MYILFVYVHFFSRTQIFSPVFHSPNGVGGTTAFTLDKHQPRTEYEYFRLAFSIATVFHLYYYLLPGACTHGVFFITCINYG